MSNRITRALLAVGVAVGVSMGTMAQAEASVNYKIRSCTYAGFPDVYLQVSSWQNDSRTQKTYHFHAHAPGDAPTRGFTVYGVYWNGVKLNTTGTLDVEGYRYSTYLGDTPWKAVWWRYLSGVPLYKVSCSLTV